MCEIERKINDLSIYRLDRAIEDLDSAKTTYAANELRTANNRAYYAIFHALRAVLALDEYDSKKHSGIISEFRVRYIKTKIFDPEISDMIGSAFEVRNKSDYDDMYVVSRSTTEKQIENAEKIVDIIKDYLNNKGIHH